MTMLENLDHEIFAHGVARGLKIKDAYAELGLDPDSGNPRRWMKQAPIVKRVGELRAEYATVARAGPMAVILALVRMADTLEALDSPAAFKEARQNLIEAAALRQSMLEAPQQRFGYGLTV